MHGMDALPLGSMAFCVAALAVFIISLNIIKLYRRNHNPLGLVHGCLAFCSACFMLCLGLPFLLTKNHDILLIADYVAVGLMGIVFVCLARIIWFTAFRNRFAFAWFAVPTALWSGFVLATDILYTTVQTTDNMLVYKSASITLLLKGLLFLVLPLPVAFIYLRQVFKVHEIRSRLRLLAISVFITLISLSGALENFHSGGKGSRSSDVFRLALSFVLLVVALWPRKSSATD